MWGQVLDILCPHFWLELDNCPDWLNCGADIWHLVASQVKKHDVTYSLETRVKYAQLEFILYLDRKPLYYIVNIMVPCSFLVVISLLVRTAFSQSTGPARPCVHGRIYGRTVCTAACTACTRSVHDREQGLYTAVYTYSRPVYETYRICNFLTNCCDYIRKQIKALLLLVTEVC